MERTDSHDLTHQTGLVRTDLYCTECTKVFTAKLDFDLDGNHIIECPHCRHEHCRVIKAGRVTDIRFDSKVQRIDVPPARVWKSTTQPIMSTTASAFLRDRWLNKDS